MYDCPETLVRGLPRALILILAPTPTLAPNKEGKPYPPHKPLPPATNPAPDPITREGHIEQFWLLACYAH